MATALPLIDSKQDFHPDIEEALRVLNFKSAALLEVGLSLGKPFLKALDLLMQTQGRVIVSGMGKSGHIGCKISATLASTGTPSSFVHPAEASHGDLGMLTPKDTLLMLSNSGETTELSDILAYATRHQIPVVAITQKAESTLAQMATTALILPKLEEVCSLGLAPTTSTTMALALGDALAVCLSKRKGFSAEDFGNLHPGGKLGQKLLKVEKIMHTKEAIPLLQENSLMRDVIIEMSQKAFGCVGLVDNQGALTGLITDGDLRRHMSENLLSLKASDVMTKNPKSISPSFLAEEALAFMTQNGITNLFITQEQDGRSFPIGIVHLHDCLRSGVR